MRKTETGLGFRERVSVGRKRTDQVNNGYVVSNKWLTGSLECERVG
jgi:hypothetical protein